MLRKRTRSNLKDQQMVQLTADGVSDSKFYSDILGQKPRNGSFFNVPLFVGFNSKGSESDSAQSPTSPLDFRVFSSLGNPFRSPRSSQEGRHNLWGKNKVGLGIIDSPDFEAEHSGKVLRASDSKNIIFGIKTLNQSSILAPNSLPKDVGISSYTKNRASNLQRDSSDVKFEIGDYAFEHESSGNLLSFSFDSKRSGSNLGRLSRSSSFLHSKSSIFENGNGRSVEKGLNLDVKQNPVIGSNGSFNHIIGNISPNEIELSEDYTCVRIHGPNPKVTHIFGDCILESHKNDLIDVVKNKEDAVVSPLAAEISKASPYPSSDFLRFCHACNKRLDGEDIYMYRGEKAFCSCNCRLQEILIDEEIEQVNNDNREDISKPSNYKKSSEVSWFIST